MTVPESAARALSWLREGETRFVNELEGLTDDEIGMDSALPNWSRAHVAAHLARNSEALSRLLSWARTGEENPMYPDTETRNRDIESSVRQDPAALRADVRDSAARFAADVDSLPARAWDARVRTFQGRDIPASSVLWMRVREVWLHMVDLGSGVAVESWPGELVDALLDEVTATMSGRDDAPELRLEATDRERNWQIGTGSGNAQEVSGKAADHLAWLTGRSTGEGLATAGVLPAPPHWM